MPAPLPQHSITTCPAPGRTGIWSPPAVEELQALLPQYEILSVLGRGGMGAVYKGRQKSLDRLVAIKILPPGLDGEGAGFKERFQNEARTMARLMHPGIVAVFDFGETAGGQLYFVMEYVDGTDVAQMISTNGPLPPANALSITAHVCDALACAHSSGIIHRDIKPANILINRQGQVKVADFGLAKADDPSLTSALTKTGLTMGTPDFVAPEALLPGTPVDGRADLYAIGVMLYQMLTGEIPRGLFQMPGVRTNGGIDPRFDLIITRAMQADREQRYQTASEIRKDLDHISTTPRLRPDASGPLAAVPEQAVQNVPGQRDADTSAGRNHSASPVPKSKRKKSPLTAILGIAAVLLVAAGIAAIFSGGKKDGASAGEHSPDSPKTPPPSNKIVESSNHVPATDAAAEWTDSLAEWWAVYGELKGVGTFLVREPGGSRVGKATSIKAWEKRGGNISNVAIRATVSESDGFRLHLRAGADNLRYCASLHPGGRRSIELESDTGQPVAVLANYPPPIGFTATSRHTGEFRARGDRLTFLLDGEEVASAVDSRITTGQGYLVAPSGALIEKFEYRDLSNAAAGAPWKDWLAEWWGDPATAQNGWFTNEYGGARITDSQKTARIGRFRDVAIRVTARGDRGDENWGLMLRASFAGKRRCYYIMPHRIGLSGEVSLETGERTTTLHWWEIPPGFSRTSSHTLEASIQGDRLVCTLDGRLVADIRDPAIPEAGDAHLAGDAGVFIEKLEYRELPAQEK